MFAAFLRKGVDSFSGLELSAALRQVFESSGCLLATVGG